MNIELHVEKLIIDGLALSPRHGESVKAAVEAELTRLLAAGGLSAALLTGGPVANMQPSSIQLSGGEPDATGVGQQIAAAINGRIGNRTEGGH